MNVKDCSRIYHSAEGSKSEDAFICIRDDHVIFMKLINISIRKAVIQLAELNDEIKKGASGSDIFLLYATGHSAIQKKASQPIPNGF
jgi:hypothetical protein